jgi:hypothetical protein
MGGGAWVPDAQNRKEYKSDDNISEEIGAGAWAWSREWAAASHGQDGGGHRYGDVNGVLDGRAFGL